jgi:hypothetical protein
MASRRRGNKTNVLLWAGLARDASGELTARQQDKCLLLGRSGKRRQASVGGLFVIVSSSSSLSPSLLVIGSRVGGSRCLLVAVCVATMLVGGRWLGGS